MNQEQLHFGRVAAALILAAVLIMCLPLQAQAAAGSKDRDTGKQISVDCEGAAVLDVHSGRILYSKNGTGKFYPASTTKIMTMLVALENADSLSQTVKASKNAVYGIDPSSTAIDLKVGEKMTLKEALYGVQLASANDAAVAIAESVGGSVHKFAGMMNKKAKELHLKNTHFTNPHGLYDPNHYTCPEDLARITQAALANPQYVKIFTTLYHVIPRTNKSKKRELYNTHRMVKYQPSYHPAVIGGKTGYITESAFNLVTVGRKNGMELAIVTMRGISADAMVQDTRKLLNYYLRHYHELTIKPSLRPMQIGGLNNQKVKAAKSVKVMVPKSVKSADLRCRAELSDHLRFPVSKGTKIGTVEVLSGSTVVGTTDLLADETLLTTSLHNMHLAVAIAVPCLLGAVIVVLVVVLVRCRGQKKSKS
ncbi:MAG: D-alanyl-D-alanine carboxypeptidase family protein [Anaerovoracaceae bacterium]